MTSKSQWFNRELAEAHHEPGVYYTECDHHKGPYDVEQDLWQTLGADWTADLPEVLKIYLQEYEDWWEDTHIYAEESFYSCEDNVYGILCRACTDIAGDTVWPCEWYQPTQQEIEHILQEPNPPSFPKPLEPPPLPTTLLGSPTAEQEAR